MEREVRVVGRSTVRLHRKQGYYDCYRGLEIAINSVLAPPDWPEGQEIEVIITLAPITGDGD